MINNKTLIKIVFIFLIIVFIIGMLIPFALL